MVGSWRREKEGFGEEDREEGMEERIEEREWMDECALEEKDDDDGGVSEVLTMVGVLAIEERDSMEDCASEVDDNGVSKVVTTVGVVVIFEVAVAVGDSRLEEEEEEESDIG